MAFYVVAGLVFLFSLGVRQHLKSTYKRWSQVRSATGRPGAQVARIILDANRLSRYRSSPSRESSPTITTHATSSCASPRTTLSATAWRRQRSPRTSADMRCRTPTTTGRWSFGPP